MSEPTFADAKGELARLGVSLPADARMAAIGEIPKEGPARVVVLDRVQKCGTPAYCVHGYTNCIGCDHPCYLGSGTFDTVTTGKALPLCQECATRWVPEGTPGTDWAADHLRADGPH